MKKALKLFIPIALAFTFTFCNSNAEKIDDGLVEDNATKQAVQETKLNAQNVFNSMPDRKEILKLIDEQKIDYNADLLNDPNSVNKYNIEFTKAANLGIYGSDLTIASSFDQTQESMVFLKCVNILASDLGVSNAFDQKMFDRMEANKQNKDSTLEVVTGAFKKADEILKSNNRPATSAIILAGSWIEGLYVSCQIAQSLNSESVTKTILTQKESLKNLVVMLEASNLDETAHFMVTDLKVLLTNYQTAEQLKTTDVATIKDIALTVTALRKKIVAGS
ncbi:MAG: hypothetical protein K0S32_4272 [Bacteroidetes bacterium]|jgi:hypothetical protein|nr:hypothetical protein [Bacteroidota bacterium]